MAAEQTDLDGKRRTRDEEVRERGKAEKGAKEKEEDGQEAQMRSQCR